MCTRRFVSLELLTTLLNPCPEAAKEKDNQGLTPLHWMCWNENASLDMVTTLLSAYPKAAREKGSWDNTPLLNVCSNKNAPLEIVQKVLNEWMRVKENRSSHSVNSLISDAEHWLGFMRGDIKELLCRLSSLFEEGNQNNPSLWTS
mmetsp:Transcript_22360/g.33431  ORF Transcript_22360/g.33431 Transcript_22360/m.33431 type:complete len:146 (+) Transcript_22360:224-661(+)